jgi:ABC-type dipeptide/oligopeptide/nickel transport system permease component
VQPPLERIDTHDLRLAGVHAVCPDVKQRRWKPLGPAPGVDGNTLAVRLCSRALRNALIPTINIVALQTGLLLSGNMIIETVFRYPGLGKLAVDAIGAADYPLVQAVVLIYAGSYVLLNLGAGILHAVLDPTVRPI